MLRISFINTRRRHHTFQFSPFTFQQSVNKDSSRFIGIVLSVILYYTLKMQTDSRTPRLARGAPLIPTAT